MNGKSNDCGSGTMSEQLLFIQHGHLTMLGHLHILAFDDYSVCSVAGSERKFVFS